MIPVVLSYSSDTPHHDDVFACELRELADVAGAAAHAAGLDVTWVNAAAPQADAAALVQAAAGVIVLGGADVDPARYGADADGTDMGAVNPEADTFEAQLLEETLRAGIPLFTICRGTQLLNVVRGGTLVQDLGEGMHRDPVPGAPMVPHDVDVREGSLLASVLGAGVHETRSGHHQAIDVVGDGLVVVATAPDGVIEAVEMPSATWVVGVQWHPEEAAADPAPLAALLADFARAAGAERALAG